MNDTLRTVQSKDVRKLVNKIYRLSNNGAKLVRMQSSLPPGMRMDGAAMAKIDTSVRSSCEKMGKLDAVLVDCVLAMRRVCAGRKKFKGKKKRDGAR